MEVDEGRLAVTGSPSPSRPSRTASRRSSDRPGKGSSPSSATTRRAAWAPQARTPQLPGPLTFRQRRNPPPCPRTGVKAHGPYPLLGYYDATEHLHGGRLLPHRRPDGRADHRGCAPLHGRGPHQEHDPGAERRSTRGGGAAARFAPGGFRGRPRRDARSASRRAGLRLRRDPGRADRSGSGACTLRAARGGQVQVAGTGRGAGGDAAGSQVGKIDRRWLRGLATDLRVEPGRS